MTAPVVRVSGLRKHYGTTEVLRGVDLDVAPGECVALLGPNGAGKTTTVEILEGFRSRDAGDVEVLGEDPGRADRAWRARIGVVAQDDLGAVDLTVGEMIRHFAHYHVDPRPAGELVEMVGLQEKVRTRVTDLSGGQRRRLDVALGVQGRPELLFLDEPTTGFDPAARRQFWTLVETLQAEGTTILLTTHYLEEAARLADRVAVIARGRVVAVATPDALGGRLELGATVTWRDAGGARHQEVTLRPTAVLREVLADHPDGEVAELTVVRPSLEDVYLALIETEEPP
ncbi:ABC transporter ATP-binding protein [Jatrophihabitans sp. YIM 134969]